MDVVWIGYMAGVLTTVSFVPQVVRALKTRHCDDLSWVWLFVFQTGLGLWFLYGLILTNWPMILSNSITMGLCSALMVMKARYKGKAADRAARA